MENINQIRIISVWIFIITFFSLNLCLFISVNGHLLQGTIFQVDPMGRSAFTIPYIDGNVSISRTARTFPAYLIFKPGMFITAILLIKYWRANNKLIQTINNDFSKNKYFLFFGVGSAVCLVIHSLLLGIQFEVDLYKFFRRLVLLAFIIFELVAQAMLINNIIKIRNMIAETINRKILILKIFVVTVLIIIGVLSLPILTSSGYVHFKHALEWNFFLGVIIFYLFTFLFWRKRTKTSVLTPEDA
uniref:Frag1/DRAM/Sfk1 family protein n=1 Tax=uncultured marine microorganism HF4000_141I21 TaxID=455526 RepID=B3T2I9_9ZZZZ|nr:hypothetical protein ALOHA_HF4000141I21ctg1g20 [uncultured marine microorganism HF4000_141I21]